MNTNSTPVMEVYGAAVRAEGHAPFGPDDLEAIKRILRSERTNWRDELYPEDARRKLETGKAVHAPNSPQEPLFVAFDLDIEAAEVPVFQRFVAAAGLGVELVLREITGMDEFYGGKRVHRVEHVTCTLQFAEFEDCPYVSGYWRVWATYEVHE